MKKKQVVYYDSLLGDNMVCTTALLDWLVQEAKDKKGMSYDVSDWKKIAPKVSTPSMWKHLDTVCLFTPA